MTRKASSVSRAVALTRQPDEPDKEDLECYSLICSTSAIPPPTCADELGVGRQCRPDPRERGHVRSARPQAQAACRPLHRRQRLVQCAGPGAGRGGDGRRVEVNLRVSGKSAGRVGVTGIQEVEQQTVHGTNDRLLVENSL